MRNVRKFLLAYCTDKCDGGFCVEKLSSWLEGTYYEYIIEAVNNLTKLLTLLETEPINNMSSLLGQFKHLLFSENIDNLDEKVIQQITTHFSSPVLLADSPASAAKLYYLVANLPSTTTKAAIEKETGIKLNVIYDPNVSDNIITGTLSGKRILAKILIGIESEKEIAAVNQLNENTTCPMLVPTKVFSVSLNSTELKKYRHTSGMFRSLIMPHYPCSHNDWTFKSRNITRRTKNVRGFRIYSLSKYCSHGYQTFTVCGFPKVYCKIQN